MSDRSDHPFAVDDAAFVLGSLPPAEREAFERHLRDCARCRDSVAALAGLPGLLRSVPPDVAVALARGDPGAADRAEDPGGPDQRPPAGLLEALLAEVGRRRRRRLAVLAGAAAAAVLALAVVVPRLGGEPAPEQVRVVALDQLEPGPPAVTARLAAVPWGTRIELVCDYQGLDDPTGYGGRPTYSLVVGEAGGRVEQVATWRAVPGRTVTIVAASAVPAGRIAQIEVRRADGTPVLRAAS